MDVFGGYLSRSHLLTVILKSTYSRNVGYILRRSETTRIPSFFLKKKNEHSCFTTYLKYDTISQNIYRKSFFSVLL